jgi:PDZ domain-containing secreted protein
MSKAAMPAKVVGTLVGLLVLAGIVLYLIPSNDYLLLPDSAHPVAPLVKVQGGHDPKGPGGIYFVDVFERHASMFESLFPWIHSGATLVPANLIVPPGVSDQAARQADLRVIRSRQVAAAVALRRSATKSSRKPSGVVVAALPRSLTPASSSVRFDRAVNGVPIATCAHSREGEPGIVTLAIDRAQHLIPRQDDRRHDEQAATIVGFSPEQAAEICCR